MKLQQTTYSVEDMDRATYFVMNSTRMLDENFTTFDSGRARGYIQFLTDYSEVPTVRRVIGMLQEEIRLREGVPLEVIQQSREVIRELEREYDWLSVAIFADHVRVYANGQGNFADFTLKTLERLAQENAVRTKEAADFRLECDLANVRGDD